MILDSESVPEQEDLKMTPWYKAVKETVVWPLVIGFFLIICGLGILFHWEPKSLGMKVVIAGVTELGFAFVIAWVALATLEVRSRDKHESETAEREDQFRNEIKTRERLLNRNIFDYLYSVRLPKELFEAVEKFIFQSHFLKTKQRVEYEFLEEKDDWILTRGLFEYDVQNISSEEREYDVKFFLEITDTADVPEFTKSGLYLVYVGKELAKDQFEELDEAAEDTKTHTRYMRKVMIQPGETLTVRIGFYLPKRSVDAELWQSIDISSNLQVVVRYSPEKFDLSITPVHACDKFDRLDYDNHGLVAELTRPLLNRNGFYMWWSPKKIEASKKP